jgi:hypothetical protein
MQRASQLAAGLALVLFASLLPVWAADVIVTGALVEVNDSGATPSALLDRAGRAVVTRKDEVLVTVCNTGAPRAAWRLDIRRNDVEWPVGLRLRVRRTGDGAGTGLVAGGREYVEVGPTYRTLCSGTGDRMNVPLQFKISGLPLDLDAGTHAANIVYTLVEMGR